jgi:hypothetical protein
MEVFHAVSAAEERGQWRVSAETAAERLSLDLLALRETRRDVRRVRRLRADRRRSALCQRHGRSHGLILLVTEEEPGERNDYPDHLREDVLE